MHLHRQLLGHERKPDHPEIERTFKLFAGIITDAKAQGKFEPRETYFCGGREEFRAEEFDSHNNNDPDQMKLIPEFLAGIDYVIRKAEELKIREKLVIIIQSEMGRTPTYNNGNGKDHWSIGPIMFLGAGIAGNRVIGATDEKPLLVPLNAQTLAINKEQGTRGPAVPLQVTHPIALLVGRRGTAGPLGLQAFFARTSPARWAGPGWARRFKV